MQRKRLELAISALGIGGLLSDAFRVAEIAAKGAFAQADLLTDMLEACPNRVAGLRENGFALNQNAWGQLPQIVVDSRYGFTIGNPARFGAGSYPDEQLFRLQESLDWVHGKLLIRAGAEVGHNSDATSLLRNQTGTYYYSTVANFISDALAFGAFGYGGALDKFNPHNCDGPARSGATPVAICAASAACPATPTTRRPWARPTGT